MSIPVTDWECPPPKAGERPVVISEAARITGHSRSAIRVRVDDGRLPYRVPVGQTKPRKVFPSQVLAVFGEGGGIMTELDRIIERRPWVALLIMALCCLAVCTADGWW